MIISGNPLCFVMNDREEELQDARIKNLQEKLLQEKIRTQIILNQQLESQVNTIPQPSPN